MTLPPPTPPHEPDWRKQPPRLNHHHFEFVFEIIAVIISVIIGRALFPGDASYWTNVYMTLVGVLITVLVLDRRAERRDRLREERELKAQLVRDVRSNVNSIAINAVHQLREHRWLSVLKGADLALSNLQGADLHGASLQGTDFFEANLEEANLRIANLQGSRLFKANLYRANLSATDLQNADLAVANLQNAYLRLANLQNTRLVITDLRNADLCGAELQGANLKGAQLKNALFSQDMLYAKFDETTILPDGTYWTPDTDMTRFTNPKAEDSQ